MRALFKKRLLIALLDNQFSKHQLLIFPIYWCFPARYMYPYYLKPDLIILKITRKKSLVKYIKTERLSEKQITAVYMKIKKNPRFISNKDRSEVEEQRGSTGQNNSNQTDCRCRPEFCSMQRSLGETRRMEKKKRKKKPRDRANVGE